MRNRLSLAPGRCDAPPSRPSWLRLVVAAWATWALVGLGTARAQTGLVLDETGATARSGGMGQAFTGIADDSAAAYYNPAGLAFDGPKETILGFRYMEADTFIHFVGPPPPSPYPPPPPDPLDPGVQPVLVTTDTEFNPPVTTGLVVGVSGHFAPPSLVEDFPWLDRLHYGVILNLGMSSQNTFHTYQDKTQPYFFRYDTRPDLLSAVATIAYRPFDWLSLGAGVIPNVNAYQTNIAKIRLNAPADDPFHGFDIAIKVHSVMEFSPVGGVLVRVPVPDMAEDFLQLGFSYRGQVGNFFGTGPSFTFLGNGTENGGFEPQTELPEGLIVNYAGYAPSQWSWGIGLRPTSRLTLGADLVLKEFYSFKIFIHRTPNPKFENTLVPRFGAEYRMPLESDWPVLDLVERLDWRLGYYYEPTPNPSLDTEYNILDTNQHVASGGVGINFAPIAEEARLRVDLYGQYHLLTDRFTQNEGDTRRGPYTAGGGVFTLGLEVRVDW